MPAIDADAHVIETPETWGLLTGEERRYVPRILEQTFGESVRTNFRGKAQSEYWAIGNRIYPRDGNVGLNTPQESREMVDVSARLSHMDELEVDIQVLYPTLLLRPIADNPRLEFALTRSYNRWLAGIWKLGGGRLSWVAVPPLRSMDKVRDELEFSRDHGACGVFLRGLECELPLTDPYFHPLYEIAAELDMAICIHLGNGSFQVHDFYAKDTPYTKFKLPTIGAFHSLIMDRTPSKFPGLRWGIVEVGANWLPYMASDLALRFLNEGRRLPENVLEANNFYIACEVTDDLPYVLRVSGEDHLVIGTDYGHADSSSRIDALRRLRDDGALDRRVVDKILWDNPRAFYGLS
jgi:predicted TIM-barrel fold metal-dependent hydrolase